MNNTIMNENPTIVDTRVVENFLSLEDVILIEQEEQEAYIKSGFKSTPFYRDGVLQNEITGMDGNAPQFKNNFIKSRQMLTDKMKAEFGPDIQIHAMHILKSFNPYKIHTDGIYGEYGIDENHYGAWTCVIPLEPCDTHTIIFNEWYLKSKLLHDWVEDVNPPFLDVINEETYQKYLNLEWDEYIRRLSIDTIFPWKVGSMMAASRYKFHCSDNFPAKGIPYKKAIIMWTAMPNK